MNLGILCKRVFLDIIFFKNHSKLRSEINYFNQKHKQTNRQTNETNVLDAARRRVVGAVVVAKLVRERRAVVPMRCRAAAAVEPAAVRADVAKPASVCRPLPLSG